MTRPGGQSGSEQKNVGREDEKFQDLTVLKLECCLKAVQQIVLSNMSVHIVKKYPLKCTQPQKNRVDKIKFLDVHRSYNINLGIVAIV